MITVWDDPSGMRHVLGESIEELGNYALQMIRRQSKGYYGKAIPIELGHDGETLIDRHAIGELTRLYLDIEKN